MKIRNLPYPMQDKLIQKANKSSSISVISAYRVIVSGTVQEQSTTWALPQKSKIHGRHNLILWRIFSEPLPTRSNIIWIFSGPLECLLCGTGQETSFRLFKECLFALNLWFGSSFPHHLGSLPFHSFMELGNWWLNLKIRQPSEDIACLARCITETIWNYCNLVPVKKTSA